MTSPWGNPAPLPGPPREIPVKTCCGVLVNDVCDCAAFAAEVVSAFASPIRWQNGVEATRD